MNWYVIAAAAIAALLAIWVLPPLVLLWCLPVPFAHKAKATASMLGAWLRGGWVKVFGLSAFLVVRHLVRGLPRTAEGLARWDRVYGNNWGINGDQRPWATYADVTLGKVPLDQVELGYDLTGLDPMSQAEGIPLLVPVDQQTPTYYSEQPARSDAARRTWLGSRNRCTNLATRMGVPWPTGPKQAWGDIWCDRSRPGWALFEQGGRYHLVAALPVPWGRILPVNWGYALNLTRDRSMARCTAELKPFGLSKRADGPTVDQRFFALPPSKRAEIEAIVLHGRSA
ncbi:hypothetical protein [Xylophilus ampelinus]|uniref:Uncharacterized protein n=1 Tax=Xylophilus ampelinus TaxID=54067 RepID=A0A318SX56_9BURK|nr:hypothetical protein [Xylophilus ampelinus]MCS4508878.1 hypothetical protein [Xylophilus ampelinus]PYE79447.1 hypothetical protein DFQ15_102180 [Xylophilus ampelinus]